MTKKAKILIGVSSLVVVGALAYFAFKKNGFLRTKKKPTKDINRQSNGQDSLYETPIVKGEKSYRVEMLQNHLASLDPFYDTILKKGYADEGLPPAQKGVLDTTTLYVSFTELCWGSEKYAGNNRICDTSSVFRAKNENSLMPDMINELFTRK